MRTARRLWMVAVAALALGFVGTCAASGYLDRGPNLEEWTAKLMPPDGHVLHSETQGEHHLIAYKARGSELLVACVHPEHWLVRQRSVTGVLTLGLPGPGPTPDNLVPCTMYPLDPATPEVDRMGFQIPSSYAGELHVTAREFFDPYVRGFEPQPAWYGLVARWP